MAALLFLACAVLSSSAGVEVARAMRPWRGPTFAWRQTSSGQLGVLPADRGQGLSFEGEGRWLWASGRARTQGSHLPARGCPCATSWAASHSKGGHWQTVGHSSSALRGVIQVSGLGICVCHEGSALVQICAASAAEAENSGPECWVCHACLSWSPCLGCLPVLS